MAPSIPPIPPTTDLSGKTILVTGGNSGLGFEAARQFLTLKAARVIITVRSRAKGDDSINSLMADAAVKASNPNAVIEAFELDLDNYQSAIQFVARVKKEVAELDVLLCNAGMNSARFEMGGSGHERLMQVNCYTHFLIALELMPLLRSTAIARGSPSRLSFVSSYLGNANHDFGDKPVPESESILEYLDNLNNYNFQTRYPDSKLVVNAFTRRLAATVPSDEVIVNCLCPGVIYTAIDRYMPFFIRHVITVYRWLFARDIVEGGRTLIYASVLAGKDTQGKFLQHNEVDPDPPFFNTPEGDRFIQKLWKEMLAEVKREDPGFDTSCYNTGN